MKLKGLPETELEARLNEAHSRIATADFVVPPSAPVRIVALIFLLLVVTAGRNLLVLQVGPLFLGEVLFLPLLLALANRLRAIEIVVLATFALYVVAGFYRHGAFFWAVKDSMVFWYLPLVSLMSAAFTRREIRWIWTLVWCYSWLTIIVQIFPNRLGAGVILDLTKYNLSAMYIFVIIMGVMTRWVGSGGLTCFVVASILVNNFKTYYIGLLLLWLLLKNRERFSKMIGFVAFSVLAIIVIALTSDGVSLFILESYVEAINSVLNVFGISRDWTTGTAQWRTILWGNVAEDRLHSGVSGILFGGLPGHSILSSSGFNRVGIGLDPRSSHNHFLDLFGYFGIIGLLFWNYVVTRLTDRWPYSRIFLCILLIFGLTNTLFARVASCLLAYFLLGILIRTEVLVTPHRAR
jgi:hypothetical protein